MKVSEVLKCVSSGLSTEEVKTIMGQNKISADEAIDLVKAGYTAESLKGVLDEPDAEITDPKPETPKETESSKALEEIEKLKKELEDTKQSLEKAQKDNLNKDVGPGEKPDPTEYLAKLFAQ